ncbi:MAG TPA: ATP-binding protein, partial [Polyangiaceae bacterium]|nr:ATP-binding protein [Polyangiaceae bacterium]
MTSLGRQLLWASLRSGVPPLAVLAIVSLFVASQQIDSGLRARLLAGARGAEIAMRTALERTRARAEAVTKDPALQRSLAEGQQLAALSFAERAIDVIGVDRVTIIDPNNRVVARGHLPALDGDLWSETELHRGQLEWRALGAGGAGVGPLVAVPILDTSQRLLGTLLVQTAIDHAILQDLHRQFGLAFNIWDGDRLQATTLSASADLAESERARQALSGETSVYLGHAHYFARAAFADESSGPGTLVVGIDTQQARTLQAHLVLLYLAVAIGMVGLATAVAFFSARRIVQPIRRLAGAAEAAARGDFEAQMPRDGPREIQELAESFAYMLGKRREVEEELRRTQVELEQRVVVRTEALRQSEEHLRQARQLESLGRLAGGVAHDFNNVLTAIGGNAELLTDELASLGVPTSVKEGMREIQQSTSHAAEIVRQLLAFSRQQVAEPVVMDVGATVSDLEKMLRRLCTEDVKLSLAVAPGLRPIVADPTQVGQILVNLVVNAQDALPEGGNVQVRVYQVKNDAASATSVPGLATGHHVCLEVADDGVGMDLETARRIFDPFFTTKAPGKGTGMGLATVHGIVKQCNAHIDVETSPGGGAKFRIFFPASTQSVTQRRIDVEQAAPRGRETLLICEDEVRVRALTASFLRGGDYEVLVASSGKEALEIFEQRRDVALLVTDVVMPEMNGVQLARQLRERMPQLRVLYLSGYTATIIDSRTDLGAQDEVLAKPFTRSELLSRVRRALD